MADGPVIVLTRPPAQADATAQRLRTAGYAVRTLPLLDIVELPATPSLIRRCAQATRADTLIVTSRNAAAALLKHAPPPWSARTIAVGRSTARALSAGGVKDVVHPRERFDSAGVLALPGLDRIEGQHVVVAAGIGGRRKILLELRRRGARVDKLALYRRVAIDHPAERVARTCAGAAAVVLTSAQGLRRWAELSAGLPCRQRRACALVVPSARVIQHANTLGLTPPIWMPARMDDDALLALLAQRVPVHSRAP